MAENATAWTADDLLGRLVGHSMTDVALGESSLLHVSGGSGFAGQYQGADAILGLVRRMVELTEETLRFRTSDVLVADDRTIVLCGRLVGARRRKHLDSPAVQVLTLRDQKIRDLWIFHQNQGQVDEFWSEGN